MWLWWPVFRYADRTGESGGAFVILVAQTTPQRAQRFFKCWTRLSFQVIGGATVTLSREQGEAQTTADGVQLTQANTSPPYDTWWRGELWYRSSVDNTSFVMLIIGESADADLSYRGGSM
jgi:hypothetical protein